MSRDSRTKSPWARTIFAPTASGRIPDSARCIADVDGAPAGLAIFFFNYSTWVSRLGLYLEDLYVRPAYRSQRGCTGAALPAGGHRKTRGLRTFSMDGPSGEFPRDPGVRKLRRLDRHDDWLMMIGEGCGLDALAAGNDG